MGNPCGKIVQNGTDYDLIPYAHKISVTGDGVKTYKEKLHELATKLFPEDNSYTDMHFAILTISGIRYTYNGKIGQRGAEFARCNCGQTSLQIDTIRIAGTENNCHYYNFSVNSSSVDSTTYDNYVFQSGEIMSVYYS